MKSLTLSVRAGVLCFALFPAFACADSLLDEFYGLFGIESVENSGTSAFPVLDVPAGGRNDAMGGAYTAVADIGAFAEANPAATAGRTGSSFAFAHQDWIADANVETVRYSRSADVVGFGVSAKYFRVPFTAYDAVGGRIGVGHFSEGVVAFNLSIRFIETARIAFAVGVNAKTVFRHVAATIAEDQSAMSLPIDLGLLAKLRLLALAPPRSDPFDDLNLSIGVSLRNVGQMNERLDARLPTVLSIGFAYAPVPAILVAADLKTPVSFDPTHDPAEPFYGAVGLSVAATRFLALHAGARIRRADYRMSLGGSLLIGPVEIVVTYLVGPANGVGPEGSVSTSIALRSEE